jgi:hypothetical protein
MYCMCVCMYVCTVCTYIHTYIPIVTLPCCGQVVGGREWNPLHPAEAFSLPNLLPLHPHSIFSSSVVHFCFRDLLSFYPSSDYCSASLRRRCCFGVASGRNIGFDMPRPSFALVLIVPPPNARSSSTISIYPPSSVTFFARLAA